MPFSKSDFAIIAATERGGRAAFLLRAVDRVRKAIVGGDVIELRGGLVVPRAPGGATVDGDHRALVGGERNDLGIFGIDPDALVIVAARRTFKTDEGFASVAGFPGGGVRHIDEIRIVGGNGDAHGARSAATDATVGVYELPRFAGVIRKIDTGASLGFHGGVDAVRLARSYSDADASE